MTVLLIKVCGLKADERMCEFVQELCGITLDVIIDNRNQRDFEDNLVPLRDGHTVAASPGSQDGWKVVAIMVISRWRLQQFTSVHIRLAHMHITHKTI